MNLLLDNKNIILIILTTFISSLIYVPIVKRIAHHIGAIDIPDERKVHKKPMPRLGGLAIFASFLTGYILFADITTKMISILIGGFIVILTGIIDDIKPLRARTKFLAQLLAACIVVFYGGIYLTDTSILGMYFNFGDWGILVSILFIMGAINAINLIDGLDGLAAGTCSIYYITMLVIGLTVKVSHGGLDVMLCTIMIGSTLGFLVYNFNPASIFMGDTGSMFLGYMIAVIALLGFKTATFTSFVIPILIMFIPILDTLLAIFRRMLKGENIGAPDKEHLHHQLLKRTSSVKKTVLLIYFTNICFSIVSVLYSWGNTKSAMIIYAVLMVITLFFILKTDILFKHKKKEK